MNTSDAIGFIDKVSFDGSKSEIWSKIYPEIKSRLIFLKEVGLSYLTIVVPQLCLVEKHNE